MTSAWRSPHVDRRLASGVWPFLVVIVLAVSALAGCRDASAPRGATPPIRLAIGYADSRSTDLPDAGIATLVSLLANERLVTLGRNGRAEPKLAARWAWSTDGLTWRFFLRPNLKFHDGSRVTASVVAAVLNQFLAQGTTSPTGLSPGARDIQQVEAVSDREFIIRLRRPSTLFLEAIAFIPITSDPSLGMNEHSHGTGAFQLVEHRAGGATLEAFKDYHDGRPTIDQVDIRLYPNARNAWGALMRGEIDSLYEVPPEAQDFIEHSSLTQIKSFTRPYVYTLAFSMRHPQLRKTRVRTALNLAVNRADLLTIALHGRGLPAADHVWPQHWAYNHAAPRPSFSPTEAGEILDAEGLVVSTAPGQRTPTRFSFTCLLLAGDTRFERMGLMLQRELNEIGVDMQLEALPLQQLAPRLQSGRFDAFLFELVSGHGFDWVYWFWHSTLTPRWMTTGYTAADGALDRIRGALTDADMRVAVRDLQQIFREDPPAIFLCWSQTARAVSTRFNVPSVVERDIVSTLPRWQLARPAAAQ